MYNFVIWKPTTHNVKYFIHFYAFFRQYVITVKHLYILAKNKLIKLFAYKNSENVTKVLV